MKTARKGLAILLSLLMLLSVLPLAVFAEEWKAAAESRAAEPAGEAADDAPDEPNPGKLIAAEITVGNIKSYYALNEAGKLELVGEETVGRGPKKAPRPSDSPAENETGWEGFTPAQVKAAAEWAAANPIGASTVFVNGDGKAVVVYGIGGYDAFEDNGYDLICDASDCGDDGAQNGRCLNGCTDGVTKTYSQQDIAAGPDADHKYYNAQNIWIGTDATGTYTYELTDEQGNVIYEEDGITPKTTTIEYSFIRFETYTEDADGICDVCGNAICQSADGMFGHDFSDGLCDGCGACMGAHKDLSGGTQETGDALCDICGLGADHVCADSDDEDTLCDVCGKEPHDYIDETGTTVDVGDGLCDVCGYCMGDCVDLEGATDAENNAIGDGVCDVCGKAYYTSCGHSDLFGSAACADCGKTCRHLTLGRLQQLFAQMQQMQVFLTAQKEAGVEIDEAFLNDTLTPLLTPVEKSGPVTSLASVISMRQEMQNAKNADNVFAEFCAKVNALQVGDVTAAELVGTLRKEESGATVLDGSNALFAQADSRLEQYEAAYAGTVYQNTKPYYANYAGRQAAIDSCKAKLTALTGELYDAQLSALYGSSTPKRIIVTAQNRSTVKNNMKALNEALLMKLYDTAYTDSAYKTRATNIWNGTPAGTMDDQTRRCVGFAMLDQVQAAINALKEEAFTDFHQTTYDGDGYYTKREATEDDILRDPDKDADDYVVTDSTIKTLIQKIDGYIGSPEAVALLTKLMPESFGITPEDVDGDSVITIYDLLINILFQKLVSDDLINSIFSMVFPTVTNLVSSLPDLLTDNEYVKYNASDKRYTIDILEAIMIANGTDASTAKTINDILDAITVTGNLNFYLDGGRNTKTIRKLLTDAGFSFWPSQIATLLGQVDSAKYSTIISALNGCSDNWNGVTDANGKLHFEWGVKTLNDFKGVLSVLFGAVAPALEMLFASSIEQYKKFDFEKAAYFSVLVSAVILYIPLASDGGFKFNPDEFHLYDDVIVPVFEALGVTSFAPSDGSDGKNYTFREIKFTSKNTTENTRKVVDGLLDPLLTLVQQFVSHPLEKLLSVLPNIALMMENSALFDLLDMDVNYDLYVKTSFNTNSASDFFSGLGDIIEDQIMRHWYDWLNPLKYAQLVATTAAYCMLEPLVSFLMSFLQLIDIEWLAELGLIDVSDQVNDLMKDSVIPMLPDLFNKLAAMLGGKMKTGSTTFDWPKNVAVSSRNLLGDLNLYEILDKYFLSGDAQQALGFNLGKLSDVVNWFFDNLVKDPDETPVHLLNPALLNLEELSTLGVLEKRSGSIRENDYARRWNSLNKGQYYFVNADISDVFYYGVRLIAGILGDKQAVKTILSLVGMDYDDLKAALANVAADGTDVLGVTLSALLRDSTDADGKLDLDKILHHMTTDNLLAVLCELLVPQNDYASEELTYPEAPQTTLDEVAAHDGKIPYLEYDNRWTRDFASFATNDIDDLADVLLQEIPLDLNPDTPQIETLREYAKPLLLKYLNEPSYLTLVAELLCTLYDDALAQPADLIKDATGIDVTGWEHDFGYLFRGGEAPAEKFFPDLSAERAGTDAAGKPLVDWYYRGEKVETYSDIFAAFGELLTPLQPVLDMVFCGNDFQALAYTKDGAPAGSLVTVQGHDGYNFAILPLLEAMDIENALTPDEFKELGTAKGLLQCVDLIVDHLFDIFDSDYLLADLLEMLAQVMYAVSGNGVGVMTKNFLRPLWNLLDTLRPIVNLDLDELANTMLCRFTYKIGKYSNETEMRQVLRARGAELKLRDLTVNGLLDLLSVVASVNVGGRKFLELKPPYHAAMNDLACLREPCSTKAYALNEDGEPTDREAFRLSTDGADALTTMLSMGIEILCYGSNADVLDAAIEALLGQKGVVKTAIELMKGLPAAYKTDYNWAYILGEGASAAEKTALLEQIRQSGEIAADDKRTAQGQADYEQYLKSYDMTDWDEDTAVWLVDHLDAMLANALSADLGNGQTLGGKLLEKLGVASTAEAYTVGSFAETLVNGLLSDDMLDTALGLLGAFLNGRDNENFEKLAALINGANPADALAMIHSLSAKIAKYNEAICKALTGLGIDLSMFNIDITKTVTEGGTVTYYGFDGAPTGLTRPLIDGDYTRLSGVLLGLAESVEPLLAFLLLGKDLALFNASGVTAHRARRDDLIHVTGFETYRYVLLPLLEALGFEGLQDADVYADHDYDIHALLDDLFRSLIGRIQKMLSGNTLDDLLCTLPDLLYYINSNGLAVSLQNLTAQAVAILDFYNDYADKTGDDRLTLQGLLKQFTGLDIDLAQIRLTDLFSVIAVNSKTEDGVRCPLVLSAFAKRLLDNFTTGRIYYNTASACDFDTYRMTYLDSRDKAATVTILISFALDLLEDPANDGFWKTIVGEPVHQTLINIFNLNDFKFDYQDPTWLFTEYADKDILVSALTLSKLFDLDPYAGKKWTREMAAELADNLEQFIEDMLYLLGLEINGIQIRNLRELMHALIGGMLFSNDMLNRLTGLLGKIKPLLDKYDPDGAIAGFIQRLTGIDLHAWDAYAPGGIYENGRDWGFSAEATEAAVDANGAVFEQALVELLAPVAPAMAWLLADSDYTFFAEGDGLGKNAEPIQITLPGAEGYKYALVPLFEALNIDGSPKNLVQNLRDGDICDPADYTENVKQDISYAVTGVVHPLVAMVQKLMDSTATQLLELLPSIVYFINCNGIDTVVKNLIHAVLIIANAAEPMKTQIRALVYDENGFDLYRTLNLEKIVRENLYTLAGVTEKDVKEIYEQCGGIWKTVDGLEDVDFRLLFSIGLAAVNNMLAKAGVPFKFTSIAALAVNELTHGYVRSFDSLTGKTAYTMVLDKEIDRYCYGDLLSILIRIVLKFLSVDNNTDALVALIKTKANIGGVGEAAISAFLHLLAGYMGTLGGFEVAMLSIYYTVYGASRASGSGVEAYDHVNDKLGQVVAHLTSLDNDIARAVLQVLIAEGDEQIGDIVGSQGVAGNGLIRFFKQIYDWFLRIINFFKNLFK